MTQRFNQRLKLAEEFELAVEGYLNAAKKIQSVAKNGTEHTHPDFVELLRRNNTSASKMVRFAPDGVALHANSQVIHWEAKSSINIEKDAYQTYMKYHDMGCHVLIFAKNRDKVYHQFVERVGFIPSEDIVRPFHPDARHPIDDDGWMCPRKGKGTSGYGSGTPYKTIDFSSMQEIENFYQKTNPTRKFDLTN